jgi:hypothetical protein
MRSLRGYMLVAVSIAALLGVATLPGPVQAGYGYPLRMKVWPKCFVVGNAGRMSIEVRHATPGEQYGFTLARFQWSL